MLVHDGAATGALSWLAVRCLVTFLCRIKDSSLVGETLHSRAFLVGEASRPVELPRSDCLQGTHTAAMGPKAHTLPAVAPSHSHHRTTMKSLYCTRATTHKRLRAAIILFRLFLVRSSPPSAAPHFLPFFPSIELDTGKQVTVTPDWNDRNAPKDAAEGKEFVGRMVGQVRRVSRMYRRDVD